MSADGLCERCKKCPRTPGGRFCGLCTGFMRKQMRESGYLSPTPRRQRRQQQQQNREGDDDGEYNGAWDNIVRAYEEESHDAIT